MMKPAREASHGCDPLPDCVPSRRIVGNLANEHGPDGAERSATIEFGRAVEREIPRLRRYARALAHDQHRAEDLVQNCLARALAKRHLWTPGTDLRAWLFAILHNLRVGDLRRSMREGACSHSAMTFMTAAPRHPDARLELRDLDRAIDELPEAQRTAVLLVGLEEMTYEQAAAVLSAPIGTVRSRVSRGRAELRKRLLRSTMPKAKRPVEPGIANRGRRLSSIPLSRVPKPMSTWRTDFTSPVLSHPHDEDRRQSMSETSWRGRNNIGSPPEAASDKETDRDTVETVIKAFTAAPGRLAFEAALRTYRERYPGTSEPLARRRVAKILCFAGRAEPQR